jgi:hypothetical protein
LEKDQADNLDVILTYIKERAAAQNAQITTLDGKANFGLAAASLLTTGVASLHGVDPVKTSGLALLPRLDLATFTAVASAVTTVAFGTYLLEGVATAGGALSGLVTALGQAAQQVQLHF